MSTKNSNDPIGNRTGEESNNLQTIHRRMVDWTSHTLRENCRLPPVIQGRREGKIEVTRRRVKTSKQLLDDLEGKRGYWKLKEEALDRNLWRTGFGRSCVPLVRQTTE